MRNALFARKLLWFGSLVVLTLVASALGAWYWKSSPRAQTPAPLGTSISAGAYQLRFSIEPDIPQVGVNQLTLEVRDSKGQPIAHARVEVGANMAAMGGMSAMHIPAEIREDALGVYRGTLDLPMSGEWPLTLSIDTPSLGHAETVVEMATGRAVVAPASTAPAPVAAGTNVSAGAYQLRFNIEPGTPQVGVNQLTLEVRDSKGQTIANAQVEMGVTMAAMGTMPAMHIPAEMREDPTGTYRGTLDLPMSGEWPLKISVNTPALGQAETVLEMATGRPVIAPANTAVGANAAHATESGTIQIDTRRRQLIGVTTGQVERKAVNYSVRASGRVASDERRLSDVALKFNGFIGTLSANYVGAPVHKGDPLFTVFSPALLNAQHEYLNAYRARRQGAIAADLLDGARRRLRLWDVTPQQIHELEVRGKPLDHLPIVSPVNGIVMEKMVVAGSAFSAGEKLLRIGDFSRVWVEAQVYQFELPLLKPGTPAKITFPDDPKHVLHGVVNYVAPFMEGDTRSARIRIELDNKDGVLRPDMYAEVQLAVPLGERLVVPEDAVLYSGANRVVFLDLGDGRLQPQRVHIGLRNNGWIEILDGLKKGDTIVTSGNFLISSETKLKGGLEQW